MLAMNPLGIGGTSSALYLHSRSKSATQEECKPVIGNGVRFRELMLELVSLTAPAPLLIQSGVAFLPDNISL